MIASGALQALRSAAGEAAVLEHDAIALEGAKIGVTLAPEDVPSLVATLSACHEHGVGVVVRGGGTRIAIGNAPEPTVAAWLSTAAVAGDVHVDVDEGVAWASAATPVGELEQLARGAGWLSPLEPAGPTATVGGALATALPTPRSLGLGTVRDVVLGLDVVLPDGGLTRCGARVVKNVSGYDLVKLQLGAFGTLGVLAGAWLRLRPTPEATRTLLARGHDADADGLARAAARLPGARAVACLDAVPAERVVARAGWRGVLVELAGDEAVLDASEVVLRDRADVSEGPPEAVSRLLACEQSPAEGALFFRIRVVASRMAALRSGLRDAGARTVAQPGLAQVTAEIPLGRDDEAAADAACRAVHACVAGNGHAVLERAPTWAKLGRDVFGAPRETLPLQRALKREFDPARVLNPGRFVGGL